MFLRKFTACILWEVSLQLTAKIVRVHFRWNMRPSIGSTVDELSSFGLDFSGFVL